MSGGELHFAAKNTNTRARELSHTVKAQWIAEKLHESKFRHIVVVLNCCFAGAFATREDLEHNVPVSRSIEGMAERKNLVVLSAANATEYAFDLDAIRPPVSRADEGLSTFTWALLDGLTTGEADSDGSGDITAVELHEYVRNEMWRARTNSTPHLVNRNDGKHIVVATNARRTDANGLPSYLSEKATHQEDDERTDAVELLRWYAGHPDPTKRETAAESLRRLADDKSKVVKDAAIDTLKKLVIDSPPRPVKEPTPTPSKPVERPPPQPWWKSRRLLVLLVGILVISVMGALWWRLWFNVSGSIEINGSSTIMPVVDQIADAFELRSHTTIHGATTGSVAGLTGFCAAGSEIDITGASRPMNAREDEACDRAGFSDVKEFLIGHDGITVVVARDGPLQLGQLTIAELRSIFGRDGATTWDEVRSELPNERIHTCMPDRESGTHDSFQQHVMGDSGDGTQAPSALRPPEDPFHVHSADDTALAQCARKPYTIAFFGHGHYERNVDTLELVPIAGDEGGTPIEPDHGSIVSGSYPLSRQLHIYVRDNSISTKPQVAAFLEFFFDEAEGAVDDQGYTPAPSAVYEGHIDELREVREAERG